VTHVTVPTMPSCRIPVIEALGSNPPSDAINDPQGKPNGARTITSVMAPPRCLLRSTSRAAK